VPKKKTQALSGNNEDMVEGALGANRPWPVISNQKRTQKGGRKIFHEEVDRSIW
jgi:hypothetical protein